MFHSSLSPGKTILKSKIKVIFGEEWKEPVGWFFPRILCTWKLYHVLGLREAPTVDRFWVRIYEVCVTSLGALFASSQPVTQGWGVACIWQATWFPTAHRFGGGWSLLLRCSTHVLVLFVGLGAWVGKGKPTFVFWNAVTFFFYLLSMSGIVR